MYSLNEQANAFGLMLIAGLVVGFLFDFYRVGRGKVLPTGVLATFITDLIFSFIAAAIIFAFLIAGSWGEFRVHLLLGALSGLVFYFFIFSRSTLRFLAWLFHLGYRGRRLAGAGAQNLLYRGLNLGVGFGRKVGLDRLTARGKKRMGALQERVAKFSPKLRFKVEGRPRKEKPKVGKRINRAARVFSARSRNLVRGLGKGFWHKG